MTIGATYRAIGPNTGKLAPATLVTVVGERGDYFITEGARQAARVIRKDCAHFWVPLTAEELAL